MPTKFDTVAAWLPVPLLVAAIFGFRVVFGAALIVLILSWKAVSVCRALLAPRASRSAGRALA